ncbi:hypothetical protein [Candidatus Wolbachia massiliensis]|uniref:Uncharacterized protein n=1 Tax=Candidatus Wolbachia massiliensis TaxID=1845000 RepID=A0A7L7YPV0_9RICK|nr:hypothetical protein [Candidatus Wolbachia massiliensis]QOD38095.1 hypothetical protein ID128_04730 [Candidatus Wolbachia massiliensis]
MLAKIWDTIGQIFSWGQDSSTGSSKKRSANQTNSQNVLPERQSRENVTILSSQTNLQFDESQIKSVLSDFEKLNFEDNKCFDKIASSYREQGKVSLFDYVILNKRKEIIDILDDKLPLKNQEEFRKRFGEYLLFRIGEGMSYGKELQNRLQSFEDRAEEVLSDFEKLNFSFKDNKCEDPSDCVNYNNGRPADPFDKIANYYRKGKDIFLFNYVVLSKQKEIMNTLDKKFTSQDQEQLKENFKKRLGRYLLRIDEGMNDAKEFLEEDDLIGFFDGCYWPDEKAGRFVNHYNNLSINITKPGKSLETSRLFTNKTERMERNKNEVERAKIYSNGKRIVTIEKNEKQQRNYSFEKSAICDMEISWDAKDESGKDLNCVVVLNVNSGQISIGKSTINGKDVELKDILELAKQNEAVLIGNKALHEVLGECLIQQALCEEKKERENIVVPDFTLNGTGVTKVVDPSLQKQ